MCLAGINVTASWEFSSLSGNSGTRKCEELEEFDNDYTCCIPDFDPDKFMGRSLARGIDRFIQLALVAYREAVADVGLDPKTWDGISVGVVVGNSLAGIERLLHEQKVLQSEGDWMVSTSTCLAQ